MPHEKYNLKLVHKFFAEANYEDALPILNSLVELYPDFSLYQLKLQECQAKISRPDDIDTLLKQAQGALYEQNFTDALKKAKQIIQADKSCHQAFKIAEQAAIELELFDEANQFWLALPAYKIPKNATHRKPNPSLPKQFKLPPIIGAGNDYRYILEKASLFHATQQNYTKTVSVIIPVYNRYQILANTLAALTHQTYPQTLMQIIVVDDGSSDKVFNVIKKYESMLPIYYARQIDNGYRLAAARNMGLKLATGEAIVFLDADILPYPKDIESYMQVLHVTDQAVLIGHRRYVNVSNIDDDMILNDISVATNLPNINPNNDVADRKNAHGVSIDWHYPVYERTNYLINDVWPFTRASGGNIAFSRALLDKAGYVDEDFQAWGCEDGEHGYRMYNAGAYFIPMLNIESLHQEPLSDTPNESETGESFRAAGHKITMQIFGQKCPAPVARTQTYKHLEYEVPKVSIYIPAYNAEKYIVTAIESCLNQDFDDLEVCICNDGSTDNTLKLLEQRFSNNPKVRWFTQENGGISKATNAAIRFCRGLYIGQLDSDDCLKPHAVRTCVQILDESHIDAVYSDCDYIDEHGNYVKDGWCEGHFSRDWMLTGMLATHFRMFRKRVITRANIQCNEKIKNAVDFDLWSKISEVAHIEHVHEVLYSYRWHGDNTSIKNRKLQEQNHLIVVNDSLKRLQLDSFWSVEPTHNPLNPREINIVPAKYEKNIVPNDVIFLIPNCLKYAEKAREIRRTWAKQLEEKGFRYLFLLGNPELNVSTVEQDTLYVPCEDNYESLLLKLALGYAFLYKHFQFQYIYKIDDDCYPNLNKICQKILPQLSGKRYLGGQTHPKNTKMDDKWHFGKCSSSKLDKPFKFDTASFEFAKGGYGYFLRKDILLFIFENEQQFREELRDGVYSYEDVRIAEILDKQNIHVEPLEFYTVSLFDKSTKNDTLIYDINSREAFEQINSLFGETMMNFDSILIITYGRSGSTLLQGVLNSIDGCLIRGENENAFFHLFRFYKTLADNKDRYGHCSQITTNPWYGINEINKEKLIEQLQQLVKSILLADKLFDPNIQCYGFKEIKYIHINEAELLEYLDFLADIFPNPAFIFNTRNVDDVLKSGWWKEKEPEQVKGQIINIEQIFKQYANTHSNCFQICYEDVIANGEKLESLFNFIGASYSTKQVSQVLQIQHSYSPIQESVKQLGSDRRSD